MLIDEAKPKEALACSDATEILGKSNFRRTASSGRIKFYFLRVKYEVVKRGSFSFFVRFGTGKF